VAWSRPREDFLSTDETDGTTDADKNSLFDGSDDDEMDITSGADTDSMSGINDDSDDSALLFEDTDSVGSKTGRCIDGIFESARRSI